MFVVTTVLPVAVGPLRVQETVTFTFADLAPSVVAQVLRKASDTGSDDLLTDQVYAWPCVAVISFRSSWAGNSLSTGSGTRFSPTPSARR